MRSEPQETREGLDRELLWDRSSSIAYITLSSAPIQHRRPQQAAERPVVVTANQASRGGRLLLRPEEFRGCNVNCNHLNRKIVIFFFALAVLLRYHAVDQAAGS
jgi:hypothetical protein